MSRNSANVQGGIGKPQCQDNGRQVPVLRVTVCRLVIAFQFDANGKVVASAAAAKRRIAGMPCTPREWHELQQSAVATQQ
jgi:hypothetical protein